DPVLNCADAPLTAWSLDVVNSGGRQMGREEQTTSDCRLHSWRSALNDRSNADLPGVLPVNEVSIISGIVGAGIAMLFMRLSALERRLNRLSRLDAKVDALLKGAGI